MGFLEEPLLVSGKDCISERLPPLLPKLLNACGLSFLTCNIRLGEPTSTGSCEEWVSLTQRKPSVSVACYGCVFTLCLMLLRSGHMVFSSFCAAFCHRQYLCLCCPPIPVAWVQAGYIHPLSLLLDAVCVSQLLSWRYLLTSQLLLLEYELCEDGLAVLSLPSWCIARVKKMLNE